MECRNHEEKKEAKEVVWKESKQARKKERKKGNGVKKKKSMTCNMYSMAPGARWLHISFTFL